MGNNVLILLRLLDGKKGIGHPLLKTVLLLRLLVTSLLRGKVSVHTHQASHPAHIRIAVEATDKVDHSLVLRLGAHVEEYDEFRVEVAAETLEEPEMGGQLGAVEMLEAAEEF
jgi:hypothetical protein